MTNVEHGRKRREARAAAGLCIDCPEATAAPREPGRVTCPKHTKTRQARGRARYEYKKANGLCNYCKAPVVPGLTHCQKHRQHTVYGRTGGVKALLEDLLTDLKTQRPAAATDRAAELDALIDRIETAFRLGERRRKWREARAAKTVNF